MREHKNGKNNIWRSIFSFHETVASIAAVFFKKADVIIATHVQKTLLWQLSKVILSGMYN